MIYKKTSSTDLQILKRFIKFVTSGSFHKWGFPCSSSILTGFSLTKTNHFFGYTPIYGKPYPYENMDFPAINHYFWVCRPIDGTPPLNISILRGTEKHGPWPSGPGAVWRRLLGQFPGDKFDGATPKTLDGFWRRSQSKVDDDWRYPHDLGNLRVYI